VWPNGQTQRPGRGCASPAILAGDKEREPMLPDPVDRQKRTARPGLTSPANEKEQTYCLVLILLTMK